jgi:hypothetical protein
LRVDDAPLGFRQPEPDLFCLDLGHPNLYRRPEPLVRLGERPIALAQAGLEHVEIEDKSGTTAYHVPQGMLIVFDPARGPIPWRAASEISIVEIAPAILANFGVSAVPHMTRPASLLSS